MIGKLLSTGGGITRTSFVIPEDNPFCENGCFLEAGLLENMAQTAAAGVGYIAKLKNRIPPTGFIGGIKNFRVISLPHSGDELITEISVEHQIFEATVVNGKIYHNDVLLAECELKIFLLKN